jgi:DnaJ-class molecular chaperone
MSSTRSPDRNYYLDLELADFSAIETVKKQFKMLSLHYHPDKAMERGATPDEIDRCTAKFVVYQSAYQLLSNQIEKDHYDRWLQEATGFQQRSRKPDKAAA